MFEFRLGGIGRILFYKEPDGFRLLPFDLALFCLFWVPTMRASAIRGAVPGQALGSKYLEYDILRALFKCFSTLFVARQDGFCANKI